MAGVSRQVIMPKPELSSALQAEYLHLQKTVEDFDGKALTIKAWSVTFSLTVLVGAFVSHANTVFLIASVASILFWYLETMWKVFQLGYYERIQEIEAHFRGEELQECADQIYASWMNKWNMTTWSQIRAMAMWPHIALPHAVVAAVGFLLFALARVGVLTP